MKNFLSVIILTVMMMEVQAQILPEGFNTTFATNVPDENWNEPVGATFSTDGNRLFIWEKGGRVYVCNRRSSDGLHLRQLLPVINISDEVGNWSDHGLLGFALDPAFNSNGGYIYLYYVVDRHHLLTNGDPNNGYNVNTNQYASATIGRITRYNTHIVGGNLVADMSTRQILLGESKTTGIPILHKSHGVGTLAFALDGTLLVTVGDGASYDDTDVGYQTNEDPLNESHTYFADALADGIITKAEDVGAFRSQMLSSHSGKLLRLDPSTGNGVGSNPFFDQNNPRSPKSRVWALGLRNPFRMFIKPGAGSTNPGDGHLGEIFIGDVGFGQAEELNIVTTPGQNFGWPIYEGSAPSAQPNKSYWGYMYCKNRDELRPICDGRDTLFFHELLKQDNAAKNSDIFSDCSGELIRSGIRFIHSRPALEWAHVPGSVFVPRFNGAGEAIWPNVSSPESGVNYSGDFDGNASTGGIWYKNTAGVFPPEYTNTFLVSDFGGRWLRRLNIDFSDVVTSINDFFINPAGSRDGAIVSMAENPIDGSIVYITVGLAGDDHYLSNTTVSKIVFGGKLPPIAEIVADNNFTAGNSLTVHFSADSSYDKDGNVTKYHWNFGDPDSGVPNNESELENPTHVFTTPLDQPKMYVVTLTVEDNDTLSSQEVEFIVSLNNIPPAVQITSPIDGDRYRVGDDTVYTLQADVTDDPNQVLTYAWQTSLIHTTNGRTHSHSNPYDNNEQTTAVIDRIGCSSSDTYHWLITLKVTDDAGLSASDKAEIYPECASTLPLTLRSFSVTQQGNVNLLKWTTEFEENIEYFELERSDNGINFSPINRQDARNTNGISHYSYPDNGFSEGVVYYRLKIVEQGNTIRYSVTVKTVSATENLGLRIVPNPVNGNFSVVYKSHADDNVTIKITDLTGRVLHTVKENVNRGLNVIYLQNLPNWPAGVYFLSVQNKNDIKREKFVKTR